MGKRGPAPEPTSLNKLQGAYRPDGAPEKEAFGLLVLGRPLPDEVRGVNHTHEDPVEPR